MAEKENIVEEESVAANEDSVVDDLTEIEDKQYSSSEVKDLIQEALASEVKGLKANNSALREEKKKANDKAKSNAQIIAELGGEAGLKQIQELHSQLQKDDEVRLFVSGDREKYNERITSRVKADHAAKIKSLEEDNRSLQVATEDAIGRYRSREVLNSISDGCVKAGVNPRLMNAMVSQVEKVVYYDPETEGVLVRETSDGAVRYGKDGTPMRVEEFVDSLREDQSELFLQSTGSGAGGSIKTRQGASITTEAIRNMSVEEYKKHRETGSIK